MDDAAPFAQNLTTGNFLVFYFRITYLDLYEAFVDLV